MLALRRMLLLQVLRHSAILLAQEKVRSKFDGAKKELIFFLLISQNTSIAGKAHNWPNKI